jgi:hypothetical protein
MKNGIFKILLALAVVFLSTGLSSAVDLNVFADVRFQDVDTSKTGDHDGFSLGQLDFWALEEIGEEGNLKSFMEFVVEHNGEGFVIDLERIWIKYDTGNDLTYRMGRMHTILGRWNSRYHHGSHVQTTIDRPLFLDFEDGEAGVLPTHVVGVMADYQRQAGVGLLNFSAQFGNGSHFEAGAELNPNNTGDIDDNKFIIGRVTLEPDKWPGLQVGYSYGFSDMTLETPGVAPAFGAAVPANTVAKLVEQKLSAFDFTYEGEKFNLTGEKFFVDDTNAGGGASFETSFYYLQLELTRSDTWTPYARIERFSDVDRGSAYFTARLGAIDGEYERELFGIRYDFNTESSIKVEYQKMDTLPVGGASVSSNTYAMQWSFAF